VLSISIFGQKCPFKK